MQYYGSKLSENIAETPEGYLICQNVPIARAGIYEYQGHEIDPELAGQTVEVYRSEEEVFSPAAMSSFEGKPATNDHPRVLLTLDNVANEQRGHMQNIRRDNDLVIADIVWMDKQSIDLIKNGKREVSCGYDCLWVPLNEEKTKWEQREIVGNHVALVTKGRAGDKVAIQDSAPEKQQPERSKQRMKKVSKTFLQALGFKAWAADAEPEEIAKAMDEMAESEKEEMKDGCGGKSKDADPGMGGDDPMTQIMEAIKNISERLAALEQSDQKVHEEMGADEAFAELEGKTSMDESEKSEVIEPAKDEAFGGEESEEEEAEEAKESKKEAMDSAAIKAAKVAIMAIPNKALRDKTAREFTKAVLDAMPGKKTGYSDIQKAALSNKSKLAMDAANAPKTFAQRADAAKTNWSQAGKQMRGGN